LGSPESLLDDKSPMNDIPAGAQMGEDDCRHHIRRKNFLNEGEEVTNSLGLRASVSTDCGQTKTEPDENGAYGGFMTHSHTKGE